jgi:hypothetical protein
MRHHETHSIEGWQAAAAAAELRFDADDIDLLDLVLCVVPELRIVAFLGQQARRRALAYPVTTAHHLVKALAGETYDLHGHRVNNKTIAHSLPEEWFPIAHEGQLLSAIYLALLRCRTEAATDKEAIRNAMASSSEGG